MTFIEQIVTNPIFQLTTGLASIVGLFFIGRTVIRKIRRITKNQKKASSVGEMIIDGDDNNQAIGNINTRKNDENVDEDYQKISEKQETKIKRMAIKGSGNNQAGGDINE